MCVSCTGGAAIGLAFGLATRLVLKWMHRRGHKAPEQLALTVACAYLSFYVANALCAPCRLFWHLYLIPLRSQSRCA